MGEESGESGGPRHGAALDDVAGGAGLVHGVHRCFAKRDRIAERLHDFRLGGNLPVGILSRILTPDSRAPASSIALEVWAITAAQARAAAAVAGVQ
jgi:hypothetical protein